MSDNTMNIDKTAKKDEKERRKAARRRAEANLRRDGYKLIEKNLYMNETGDMLIITKEGKVVPPDKEDDTKYWNDFL